MNSSTLKAAGLAWLRFGKKMPIVCSEVGRWNSDVLGIDRTQSIEIEVKTSKSDIKADFKNKVAKHWSYGHVGSATNWIPNRFYFLVPQDLADDAVEILGQHNPKIGVLSFLGEDGIERWSRDIIEVRKKAHALHTAPPSAYMKQGALLRMGSELSGLRLKSAIHDKRILQSLDKSRQEFSALLARSAGTLDAEQPVQDLELRAQELADAVHQPGFFASLDLTGKKSWIEAAARVMSGELQKGWIDASHLF